jgi:hypothetical protein
MTDEELDRLEALAKAATQGPWTVDDHESAEHVHGPGPVPAATAIRHEDAAFIAASRDAVPRLVAEVRRLRAERDEANHLVSKLAPFPAHLED